MIALARNLLPVEMRTEPRELLMQHSKYVVPLVAALALVIAGTASAFVISYASSSVVQPQPPAGSCHVRGHYPFNMPDQRCTPGALNPAVTQATIHKTICRRGYSSSIRPSPSVTGPEKLASIRAYGLHQRAGSYEYDHLISLELGGAANDSRNLWPELGASPNLKDREENYLHVRVCDGRMSLARAQRVIALDWVSFYNQNVKPKPERKPPPPSPPDEGIVHPGAFCSPQGATGHTSAGRRWCVSRPQAAGIAGNAARQEKRARTATRIAVCSTRCCHRSVRRAPAADCRFTVALQLRPARV
jgi:hypothetical protein